MDDNKGPSSYDAPRPGEYGNPEASNNINNTVSETAASVTSDVKDTVTDTVASVASEVKDTITDTASSTAESSPLAAASSSTTTSTTSAFKLSESNPQPSTSHQEVFGGTVEGTTSPQNNYYTNTATSYGAPEEISKGFGIASLVMGILCILTCCCWFLSIIFGILGIIFYCVQTKDSEGKRPTQANIGLILSIVGLVISIGLVVISMLSANSSWYQEIMNSANL